MRENSLCIVSISVYHLRTTACHIRSVEVPVLLCSRFAEHRQDHRRANNYRKRLRMAGVDGVKRRRRDEGSGNLSPFLPRFVRSCACWRACALKVARTRFFSRCKSNNRYFFYFFLLFSLGPIMTSSFVRMVAASHPRHRKGSRI